MKANVVFPYILNPACCRWRAAIRPGLALLGLALLALLGACAPQPAPAVAPPVQSIRVVMDNNYPPYVFLDESGHLQGILIDQWNLWQQKTGVRVEITALDWNQALSRMQAGEFDVIDTLFYNESRAAQYDFSPPYARLDVPIFFRNTISAITDAASLKGFPVAVKSGDSAIDVLKRQGVTQLIEYPSYEAIVQAAKDQQVIVFVVDQPPALYYLYKLGIYNHFNYTAPLYSGEFHRAVAKGNTQMMQWVNRGFAAISAGEYAAIDRKWLGETPSNPWVWQVLVIGSGVIVLLVLALSGWNASLRRTVAKRTAELKQAVDDLTLDNQERKHIADALRESEERMRATIDSMEDLVIAFDADRRITNLYYSLPYEQLFTSPQAAIGHRIEELHFPDGVIDQFNRAVDLLQETGVNQSYDYALEIGGESRWYTARISLRPDPDGQFSGVTVVIRDITFRKQAEQAQEQREREAHQRMELMAALTHASMILSKAPSVDDLCRMAVELGIRHLDFDRMGIWLVDESDPQYCVGTFGVDESGQIRDERQQRAPMNPVYFESVSDENNPVLYLNQSPLYNDRRITVGIGDKAVVALWDGKVVRGYISVDNYFRRRPIDEHQGEILSLYAQVVGHLYALKLSEAAVRQLNAGLEQRVQQRTAELEASNAELRSFSYSISHDLRAPLRSLNSFSQILQEEYGADLDRQAQDYLKRIRSASIHMTNLVEALLKLTRISRSELQLKPVQLGRLACEIAARLSASQPERRVEWVLPEDLTCQADPDLMQIVLENLLGNAWKFTSQHTTARIELGCKDAEGRLVYFVRDDGAGFDARYAGRLFSPFQRLHLPSEFEGTGIGLAIVQRIIHRHQGEIWAESTLGLGATFYFTLPDRDTADANFTGG